MAEPLKDILEGKYEILDKIGEGGVGSVYKVRHLLLDEIRVIKVLRASVADREDMRHRLMQEAKTAVRLEHPNLARLHDLAVAGDGTAYMVMEYIEGVTLDALLARSGPMSVDLTLEVAQQTLAALHYLHVSGFVHRDISPDNLMLTLDFEQRPRVKLIDLGIAKDLTEKSGVTEAGTFLGKVKYCAPEMMTSQEGATNLDARSDNYSLGVSLYELLTGTYPYDGESFQQLASAHLFQQPRTFSDTDAEGRVPEPLREIILAAMEKDPEHRPQSAADFSSRLDEFEIDHEAIREEAKSAVGTMLKFANRFERYQSGSTQEHLDREFAPDDTQIRNSDSAPTPRVRTQDTVRQGAESSRRQPTDSATRSSGLRKAALLAAVLVPVAAIGGWLAFRGDPGSEAQGIVGAATTIEATPRWDPTTPATAEVPLAFPATAAAGGEEAPAATVAPPAPPIAESPAEEAPATGDAIEPVVEEPAAPIVPEEPVELLADQEGVVPPRPTAPIEPAYPKPDRKEIVVRIRALVGADGQVLASTVAEGPTFRRRYREAALAAVNAADFRPATRDGIAGKMWTEIDVVFRPDG